MKCIECDQELPTPNIVIMDALGREVTATDFILWMKPVTRVKHHGLTLTAIDCALGYKPVVLCIRRTEWGVVDNQYCIDASVMYTCGDSPVDIRGEVGVPNPDIYRLTRTITELDK